MKLGTATITNEPRHNADLFVVRWMNHGNFLQNEPRAFVSEHEARDWCHEHGLTLVHSEMEMVIKLGTF
jgi:hypothetical protein